MKDYIQLLRGNRDFSLLWMAQVVSLTGDWFNTIVLSTLVARYSDGSGLAVSLYLMARFLPPLIFGPFAGVLVDRFDRQKILVYSNIFRTVVVLGFLLATTPDRLWIIYALTIVQFTLSALFEPGQSALTPGLVAKDDLVIANTLASVTWSVMLALGAIVGGIFAAIFGAASALLFDSVTFALAAWLISRIRVPDVIETVVDEDDEPQAHDGSFIAGLRYLAANPATAAVLLIKGGSSLGNVDTLMTIYATAIFVTQINSQLSLGLMYSAFGVGAILGPLILNRFNDGAVHTMRRLVIIGFIWSFLGWILIGFAGSLLVVASALIVRGMGGSVNWTYSSVIVQKSVPDRYLGRVFSLDLAIFQLATVLSIVVHGGLVDLVRSQVTSVWYLHIPDVFTASDVTYRWLTLRIDDLALIAFGTALVSAVPLMLWSFVVIRAGRRSRLRRETALVDASTAG